VYIEEVAVRFNPLTLLRRQVTPQINLSGLRAYIEQDEDGQWVDLDLDLDEDDEDEDDDRDPLIRVNPTVGIVNSEVILQPYLETAADPMPLTISNINGTVAVTAVEVEDPREGQQAKLDAQEITLDLSAEPESAGTLEIAGVLRQLDYGDNAPPNLLDSLDAQIAIQAQNLNLELLGEIALASAPASIPIAVLGGVLSGNVEAELTPLGPPRLTGTARLRDGVLSVDALKTDFTNINTQAQFQGNRVALDNTTAEYGELAAQARGTIDIRNGYNLTGAIAPVALAGIAEAFGFEYPVEMTGTLRADDVKLTGPLAKPTVTGQVRSTEPITIDQVTLAEASSQVTYEPGAVRFADFAATPIDGGSLDGSGAFVFAQRPSSLDIQLEGRNLPADAIARPYGLPENYTIGTLALDADISGPLDNLNGVISWDAPNGTYPTQGTADIAANTVNVRDATIAGGTVAGIGRLVNGQWSIDGTAQRLQLGVFNDNLEGITGGGDVQLTGRTDNISLASIRGTGDLTASLRGGTLTGQVALANGSWNADVRTQNFPVGQFAPDLPLGGLTATAQLAGRVDALALEAIQGTGNATVAIASGTATSAFTLANGIVEADGQASNLQLSQLSPDLQGTGNTTFQVVANLDNLSPTGIQGRANVQLSDGLATATGFNAALARSRSPLDAILAWDGRQLQVERLETAGLLASGTVTPQLTGPTAPSIAAIDLGITADNYALSTLPLNLPTVLALQGQVDAQGRLTGTPDNLAFVGDMALADLALNDLVFEPLLAGNVNFSTADGLALSLLGETDEISVNAVPQTRQIDFTVRAGEAIALGETDGNLLQTQLYNFPISVLNIPPSNSQYGSLRGNIEFANASINLDTFNTTGQFDIQNLGIGFYSVDRLFGGFSYRDGVARLNEGQIVMADRDSQGAIVTTRAYDLSGRYSRNQTPQLQATLSTDEGQLQDIFEVLKISELADFRRGFIPNEGFIPSSTAEAEAILATNPVGDPNGTLLNQLRRLSEIMELEIQQELQAEQSQIPPLSELQGEFAGRVDLATTIPDDIAIEFDIAGEAWQWGPDLNADTVTAKGTYKNGLVTVAPVRLASDVEGEPAFLNLAGSFSLDPDDPTDYIMNLQAANVPANSLQDLANLPFDLDGRLNATARLRGQLEAPDLTAEIEVIDGALNNSPIAEAIATFDYTNARAALDTRLLLAGSDDPITVTAQVPYRLPFVAEEPIDKSYAIRANVEDEGFALLNLFTDQRIAWESGEGELILNLEGNIDTALTPTQFDGLILLNGATISSTALPAPMTNVTGQIRLVPTGFLIVVDRLTGQFSQGELSAQGTFPLLVPLQNLADAGFDDDSAPADNIAPPSEPDLEDATIEAAPPVENPPNIRQQPLELDLDNIALNLKGLYNGQVNGRMQLDGSLLLGPALSGEIDLSDGIITIPESSGSVAVEPTAVNGNGDSIIQPFRFDDLRIVLTRNIDIVQGRLLDVSARGGLRLDGTLSSLRPFGRIDLPSGRVGLFAVALRLAGNNDRAEFRGTFDPILDVTLQTSLPDASSSASGLNLTASPFPRNEVSDNTINNIGLTQQGNSLVRINARYTGPASELADITTDARNLQLSSSPPRSNQEIITLLSGNVIGALSTLEDGDDTLTGIGTFLGSALLGTVRDFLGDTVPLSEFRLFQVSEESGDVNEGEDIGGEIGFDVTSNISVSVLKVLTNDTPFQFNTRYRISDQFTLRGTTSYEDFSDRTGVLLEYETRF
jgi:translocation and assembly module TamB